MQVVHPMQKCPAEIVEVFQEVLRTVDWDRQRNVFLCNSIKDDMEEGYSALNQSAVHWIDKAIGGHNTFNRWLGEKTCVWDPHWFYTNQCRKAWLEWLVSPEGHCAHK